jgi:ABC-type molybdate transport system permease subunit
MKPLILIPLLAILMGCSNYSFEDYEDGLKEDPEIVGTSSAEWHFSVACEQYKSGNISGAIDSFYEARTAGEEGAQLDLAKVAKFNAEGLETYGNSFAVNGCK